MRRAWLGSLVLAALCVVAGVRLFREVRGRAPAVRATLSLQELLGGTDTAGFARAFEPQAFRFPQDHGEHPGYRTEWWYITGNLEADGGRRFGYQLTFFRSALSDSMPDRASAWAARQAWMAHFALTDATAGRFHVREQFARGAAGLAGAEAAPFRVWAGPWSIESADPLGAPDTAALAIFPLRLRAADGDLQVELVLSAGKPLVLHGDAGLSRKGAQPGNASYYLSFTRMPTSGRVRTGTGEFRVTGESWLDREWGTSGLPADVSGWDWFALQLEDGSELMFYQLRRADGSADPFSAGTYVDAAGRATKVAARDIELHVLDVWASPLDGARYPARWQLRLRAPDLDLEITPVLADQELNLSVRYWEGAVDVAGQRDGRRVRGRGYVELTGYGAAAPSVRARRRASASIVRTVGRASASGNTLASHTYSPLTSVSSSWFTTSPMRTLADGCVPRSGVVISVAGSQPASRRMRAAVASAC